MRGSGPLPLWVLLLARGERSGSFADQRWQAHEDACALRGGSRAAAKQAADEREGGRSAGAGRHSRTDGGAAGGRGHPHRQRRCHSAVRREVEAYGLVLDPVALLTDGDRIESTRAAAAAATADTTRLQSLYRDGAQASLKALQASQAQSIEANAQAQAALLTLPRAVGAACEPQPRASAMRWWSPSAGTAAAAARRRARSSRGRRASASVRWWRSTACRSRARVLGCAAAHRRAVTKRRLAAARSSRRRPGLGPGARVPGAPADPAGRADCWCRRRRLSTRRAGGLRVPSAARRARRRYSATSRCGQTADARRQRVAGATDWPAPTGSSCRAQACCGRCRASAASRRPKRITTSAHACLHRPRLAGTSEDRDGAVAPHRPAWRRRAAECAARRLSGFRAAARAGAGRGAGPGCDAGGVPGHAAARGSARRR